MISGAALTPVLAVVSGRSGGPPIALIDSLGGGEVLALLVMLMVVVGPDRLPDLARRLGQGVAKARRMVADMNDEVRGVVDDPAMAPLREIGEFALRPRQKLGELVRQAELDLDGGASSGSTSAASSSTATSSPPSRPRRTARTTETVPPGGIGVAAFSASAPRITAGTDGLPAEVAPHREDHEPTDPDAARFVDALRATARRVADDEPSGENRLDCSPRTPR